jgi:wyosine [tRNA(Phe)-imidazoG37] synthetase (radical SAM superfamily)
VSNSVYPLVKINHPQKNVEVLPFNSVKVFAEKTFTGRYCPSPFITVEITPFGGVRMCGCSDWMPTTIGSIFEKSIQELLTSPLAQSIRKSIIDGNYKYCDERSCGIITNNELSTKENFPAHATHLLDNSTEFVMPTEIFISGDFTCNLSCPSCRNQVTKNSQEETERLESLGRQIKNNLFGIATDQKITVTLSTSGELFASPLLLRMLNDIDTNDFPNLFLNIQTNGLLAKKNWHKLNMLSDRVRKITVSIDAASKPTYEKLRRGGKWEDLLEAMQFFQSIKNKLGCELVTRMVVQHDNYKEIPAFYNFSKSYQADVIEYIRILNWGTWNAQDFLQIDVANPAHEEFENLATILKSISSFTDARLVKLHDAINFSTPVVLQ